MNLIDKLEELDKAAKNLPWSPSTVLYDLYHNGSAEDSELVAKMRNALPKLLAVARAAKAHADATVNYRLGKMSEIDIAHYYNRLVKELDTLEQSE